MVILLPCRFDCRKAGQIEERSPLVVEEYQAKLQERLTNLLADNNIKVEPERLLQEVAIFADRTSITEEIVRLKSISSNLRPSLLPTSR